MEITGSFIYGNERWVNNGPGSIGFVEILMGDIFPSEFILCTRAKSVLSPLLPSSTDTCSAYFYYM